MSNPKKYSPIARSLIFASFFAALIFVATAYLPRIPTALGYIHPGDGFVLIAAACLPFPYALSAAALGGTLADLMTGYAIYAPATLMIKLLMALCISSRTKKFVSLRNLIGAATATLINAGGYYLYESLFISGSFLPPLADLPFNLFQTAIGGVIFICVGILFDRTPALRSMLPTSEKANTKDKKDEDTRQ